MKFTEKSQSVSENMGVVGENLDVYLRTGVVSEKSLCLRTQEW